jgi:hypothetical protein
MIPISINVKVNIDDMKPERTKRAIDATIAYAADKIKIESKRLCPVKTGRLQNSIRTGHLLNGRWVGPDTDYDIYVEYGHNTRGGGYVAGRSYMRGGVEVRRKNIAGFLTRTVRMAIA